MLSSLGARRSTMSIISLCLWAVAHIHTKVSTLMRFFDTVWTDAVLTEPGQTTTPGEDDTPKQGNCFKSYIDQLDGSLIPLDPTGERYSPLLKSRGFARSAMGFRDQFSLKSPQQQIQSYPFFPGLIGSIIERSRTSHNLCRDPSPLSLPSNENHHPSDPFYQPPPQYEAGPKLPPVAPCLLMPVVNVTPEIRVLDNYHSIFWVAIEVSVRMQRLAGHDEGDIRNPKLRPQQASYSNQAGKQSTRCHLFDSSDLLCTDSDEYGFLHDLQVEIQRTTNSCVLDILEHKPTAEYVPKMVIDSNFFCVLLTFLSTLKMGSKILLVANVEVDTLRSPQHRRVDHHGKRSDDLFEALEHDLGTAECEYLQISIKYRHSAFPSAMTGNGVRKAQTKLQTTFTAVINRHNSRSIWSPPPAPLPNHLLGIIASH